MSESQVAEEKRGGITKEAIGDLELLAKVAETEIEKQILPIRKSLLKRFPTLFLLLATAGFILVSFAIEELLRQYHFFTENPVVILLLGLFFLILTGAAYKKSDI